MLSLFRLLALNFLIASIPQVAAQTNPMPTGIICSDVSDIIFVIDESESIGLQDIQNTLNFITVMIQMLDVSQTKVRVGVVSFATAPFVEIAIGDYTSKTDLTNKVAAITQRLGSTHTAAGLHTAWLELVSGSTNSPRHPSIPLSSIHRVIMLFSDGLPTTTPFTTTTRSQTIIISERIKTGTWSGNLPSSTDDNDVDLLPVTGATQQLPYPVFIFSVFLENVDSDKPYMQSLSSGVPDWFIELDMNTFSNPPLVQTTAAQIVREICYSKSPTPSPAELPPPPITPMNITINGGDIHFTTLDNVIFTFNGAGDYIYASTPNKFDLHVRAAGVGKATTLAAIAIYDYDTQNVFELWWNGIGADNVILNVREKNNSKTNRVISLNEGLKIVSPFIIHNTNKYGLLTLRHQRYNDFVVSIMYHGQASFDLKIPKNWNTFGLGGNNNGNPNDDMCDRKGRCLNLSEKLTNRQVHLYALDWKVLPDELLFEKWMSVYDSELQYHPLIMTYEKLSKAKQLCGKVQPCIFDFISVGTEAYAKITKERFETQFSENGQNLYYYVGDIL